MNKYELQDIDFAISIATKLPLYLIIFRGNFINNLFFSNTIVIAMILNLLSFRWLLLFPRSVSFQVTVSRSSLPLQIKPVLVEMIYLQRVISSNKVHIIRIIKHSEHKRTHKLFRHEFKAVEVQLSCLFDKLYRDIAVSLYAC